MPSELFDADATLANIAVLVPAWQPEAGFVALVAKLVASGFGAVVVVDDGSTARCEPVFAAVAAMPRVRLLRHAKNVGKGRALKTGIDAIVTQLPQMQGVVTADADGQHLVADIVRVARALQLAQGISVLGVRRLGVDVPLRSRFGNALTRLVFVFTTGARLADTQTGLRGLPRDLLAELLLLQGERYEYEMTVLAHICRRHKPLEVLIQTVYIDGNRSSHFDPIRDSMRIYFVLLRFYSSSLIAAAIDFIGFSVAYAVSGNVATSVAIGRVSSLVNFTLNRRFVFRSSDPIAGSIWRYYALVIAVGCLSYALIWVLTRTLRWNVYAAKVAVDAALSLVSFSVQRAVVFRRYRSA